MGATALTCRSLFHQRSSSIVYVAAFSPSDLPDSQPVAIITMDFTGNFHFTAAQPYHQFMPIPPLTPSHSHSAPSDDFNSSSPDNFDGPPHPNDHRYNGFDFAQQGFSQPPPQQASSSFTASAAGPPTPPGQAIFAQPRPSVSGAPPTSNGIGGASEYGSIEQAASEFVARAKSEVDDLSNGRAGSEEENMTPAQQKRKAQNRAAQRAFRERKEKHVKDLEVKLAELENSQQRSSAENERLRRDLHRKVTENEILRATTGPMRYSPSDFASNLLSGHNNQTFSHRIVQTADGQRLLAAGASWDYIISHELFQKGQIDIGSVSDYLKTRARCDGQGPVFSERDVIDAIQASAACASDDLL